LAKHDWAGLAQTLLGRALAGLDLRELPVLRPAGRESLRPGDTDGQDFARSLGARWAGASDSAPDELLDAAIIVAPVGALLPAALKLLRKGGTAVCSGIHMSEIPAFPYADIWGERSIRSVANRTRRDGEEFLELAPRVPIRSNVHGYALEDANQALADLRAGRLQGSAVLVPPNG